MSLIQNIDAIRAIRVQAKIPNVEPAPNELGRTCVPVMDMTPRFHRTGLSFVTSQTTTGTFTLHTASTTRETSLTSLQFGIAKDATCDIATGNVAFNAVINGVTTSIMRLAVLTLTAADAFNTLTFPDPILIDKGSIVTMTGTFTVGLCSRTGGATYIEVDP